MAERDMAVGERNALISGVCGNIIQINALDI